ncbi:MAG: 4Fe-4S dicluster domain-containing protein [Gracilibacteraceae bacterium]|jgi:Fe-S oxidoreductase/nitrate reductase gamma subunit|nr:4Fe-4S dicluster domain-containing protein [Gracilibacteraceae bacterium]
MNTLSVLLFFVLAAVALFAFGAALKTKLEFIRLGTPENRFDQPGKRLAAFSARVLLQVKMLKEPYGLIHLFVFWGFILIVLGEIPFILQGLFPAIRVPLLGTSPVFYLLKDILSALVVVGLFVGLIRRWVLKPRRLYRTAEAGLVVAMILLVILTEWLTGAAEWALEPPAAYSLSFGYPLLANLFFSQTAPAALETWHTAFWWLHVIIFLGFFVYIPNSKHLHVLAAPFNGYFANLRPAGAQLPTFDPLAEEGEYGVGRVEAFSWKHLLDSFACGECGRCMENCPANLSGKLLNPKKLLCRTIKEHLLARGAALKKLGLTSTQGLTDEDFARLERRDPEAAAVLKLRLAGDVVTEDDIWACTTCGSCQNLCPVSNEHVAKIVDLRRWLVMNEDRYAPELRLAFRNSESKFNPWGVSWSERGAWAKESGVPQLKTAGEIDVLFWVGCAGSFDSRAQEVSRAVAAILQAAGVRLAILGREEKCCGDFQRRAGNEYLFRRMAKENIELLQSYKVKRIVTACPHCLNTLKNEYPALGGEFEVTHHTRFILDLLQSGRLSLKTQAEEDLALVYHDSCYLGRWQGEFEAPRELFRLIPGLRLTEMERCRDKSYCCGAGGARMWLEEHLGERINNVRVKQALTQKPQAIGANCPYCLTMLEDGVKDLDAAGVRVIDPAELIAQRL